MENLNWAVLIIMVLVCGCADHVGKTEFVCPVCKQVSAKIDDYGNGTSEDYGLFKMYCTMKNCRTKSGLFKSFEESTKHWPMAEFPRKEKEELND